jgi:hypothetical protein
VLAFAALVFLLYKLRNCGEKGHRAIMLSAGFLLLIFEAGKQALYLTNGEPYWWFVFPLQPCSLTMYSLIIAGFLKKGRVKSFLECFSAFVGIGFGAAAIVYPGAIFEVEYIYLLWQSPMHHVVLCAVGMYLLMSKRVDVCFKSYLKAAAAYLIICLGSFIFNLAVHSIAPINAMYVGPYTIWEVPLFSSFLPMDTFAVFLPIFITLNLVLALAAYGLSVGVKYGSKALSLSALRRTK